MSQEKKPKLNENPKYVQNRDKASRIFKKLIKEDIALSLAEELSSLHANEEDNKAFTNHLELLYRNFRKNKPLIEKIENKTIGVDKLVLMKSRELEPEEERKKREQFIEREESKNQPLDLDKVPDHPDTKCIKCGSRKVKENLVQLRSADEPMTRVFICLNCNTNWKRSA